MNLLKIIDMLDLDKVDQEQFLKPAMRRDLFKKAKDFSLKAALTSVPFALVAMPTIVKAASNDAIGALTLALKLEYLEADFYTMAQAAMVAGKLPSTNKPVFDQIQKHEAAHVKFLEAPLTTANALPARPTFDFTLGGTISPFTKEMDFLTLAQAFEDTGVRAYKGQAGNFMDASDKAFLNAALQIHSVEARHAAAVRRIRGEKGWITESNNTLPAAFAGVYGAGASGYPAESNVMQGGVDVTTLVTTAMISNLDVHKAATEAFDEPLDTATIVGIFSLFCKTNC